MERRKILIATDFSEASRPAVLRGVDLAVQFGAEIHLVHVLATDFATLLPPVDAAPDAERWLRGAKEHAEELMEATVREFDFEGCHLVTRVSEAPNASSGLLEEIAQYDIDTVVLGTHGRRGLRRAVLGSVAEELVRLAPCSVLTVTGESEAHPTWPREILVAVDFSPLTEGILAEARELSDLYHSTVHVVHAVPQPYYPPEYAPVAGGAVLETMPQLLEDARKALEERVAKAGPFAEGVTVEAAGGSAAAVILERANSRDVDLIVQGCRGLDGMKHLLLGSVADRVVRRAPCPVLTMHAGDVEASASDAA